MAPTATDVLGKCSIAIALFVAGCATSPPAEAPADRAARVPTYGSGYNEGLADGIATERARAVAVIQAAASAFDSAGCDVSTSWLPEHDRQIQQYAFARRREQDLKIACARKYRRAVERYQSMRRDVSHE